MAQLVKNPPAMRETWVRSLGREDPLEKGKATHYSILAWRIPWTQEPGRLQSMGLQQLDTSYRLCAAFFRLRIRDSFPRVQLKWRGGGPSGVPFSNPGVSPKADSERDDWWPECQAKLISPRKRWWFFFFFLLCRPALPYFLLVGAGAHVVCGLARRVIRSLKARGHCRSLKCGVKCARRLPHVLRSAPLRPDFLRPSDVRSLSFCCCPQCFSVVRWGCPPRAPVCSVALSPPTLCDSMGCMFSPPGSSVCPWDFFFPGRNILEEVASFSRESSQPRDRICVF